MIRRFKSNFFLVALGLSITLNAVSLDDLAHINRSFRASVSRVAAFLLSEHVVRGVGLISCVGLGLGGAAVLPPTLMYGVGCGLGIFNLWGSGTLRALLKTVNKVETDVSAHRKEFNDHRTDFGAHRAETRLNHQQVLNNLTNVQSAVDEQGKKIVAAHAILNNKIDRNEEKAENRHRNLQDGVINLSTQVKENEKNALVRDQTNKERLNDIKNKLTSETSKLSTTIASNHQSQKQDVQQVRQLVLEGHKKLSEKVDVTNCNAEQRDQSMQQRMGAVEGKLDMANDQLTTVNVSVNELLEKQQLLRNEYIATKEQIKEICDEQRSQGNDLKFLVDSKKKKTQANAQKSKEDAQKFLDLLVKWCATTKSISPSSGDGQTDSGIGRISSPDDLD